MTLIGCSSTEKDKKIASLENEITTLKTENEGCAARISDLEEQNQQSDTNIANVQNEYNELLSKFKKISKELEETNVAFEDYKLKHQDNYETFWFDDMETEALRFIREEYYSQVKKSSNPIVPDLSEMTLSNLHLGMSLDETEKVLGSDYEDSGFYDEETNQFILKRTYVDGIDLFFNPVNLNRICVTGEKYSTNLGIKVGMPMINAVSVYDNEYNRLKAHSSYGDGEVNRWIGTYLNDDESEVVEFRYGNCVYEDEELTESMLIQEIIIANYFPKYFYW